MEDTSSSEVKMIPFKYPEVATKLFEEKYRKNELTSLEFRAFWHGHVPKLFKVVTHPQTKVPKIETQPNYRDVLIRPIEDFIYNACGSKEHTLKELSKVESTVTSCGHVFRNGESTYTCRDCAMDSTCVLCVLCFQKSTHKHHRYKITSSSGGGCCDCGDVEAWKSDPWCSEHKGGDEETDVQASQTQENEFSALEELNLDLAERMKLIFESVTRYAFTCLSYVDQNIETPVDRVDPTILLLPGANSHLQVKDSYCLALYNDEVHTYEAVSTAITRAVGCTANVSMDHTLKVDNMGRAIIRYGNYEACSESKKRMREQLLRNMSIPLKTEILHEYIICLQFFALELLQWLENWVKESKAVRQALSFVLLERTIEDSSPYTILEGVIRQDPKLWKSARSQWNKLLFHSLLFDYNLKKRFSEVLTRNYKFILSEFMNDDHDLSYSVASLAVQVFTVPSLAVYLIEHHDVIFSILNSFYEHCIALCGISGERLAFTFTNNMEVKRFKRAMYVLWDLRYLLTFKPKAWNSALKQNFLHGFSIFLKLLYHMQGMLSFTRLVHQHAEYEQEWELAFQLHSKVSSVVALAHEWCGEDKLVLIKAVRATLKKLNEVSVKDSVSGPRKDLTVANCTAKCLDYDISKQSVSIHIPLTRLLAALCLHLPKYNLNFESDELMCTELTIEQVMEPALRQMALRAQVQARMWRRNGLSLPHQLMMCSSSKCRGEMLDCDVIMLQTALTLMKPNEFLITMLCRFNLTNWVQPSYIHEQRSPEDDSIREKNTLVEELLYTLLCVVGERFKVGVGEVTAQDCLCHEVVQQLCIKPMSHSELNDQLPRDVNYETHLESVVDLVADLKDQAQGKKVYELKTERRDEFNLFFYHFTREDLSIAEEYQRTLRKKESAQFNCSPPPLPPMFTNAYSKVLDVLECEVMLALMEAVLTRMMNLMTPCFSELQLQETLFLIGYALLEEERQMKMAQTGVPPDRPIKFSTRAEARQILPYHVEQLLKGRRNEVEEQLPLVNWVLAKYKDVVKLRDRKVEEPSSSAPVPEAPAEDEEAAQKAKKARAELVAQRRAGVLQKIQAQMYSFMQENADEMASVDEDMQEESVINPSSASMVGDPVAFGPDYWTVKKEKRRVICILCQETELISSSSRDYKPVVMAALVQQSTVLSRHRSSVMDDPAMNVDGKIQTTPCKSVANLCLTSNLGPAPHVSSCGHTMHKSCFDNFFESVRRKEEQRAVRRDNSFYDVRHKEYPCPLCNSLSNCAMPIFEDNSDIEDRCARQESINTHENLAEWSAIYENIYQEAVKHWGSFAENPLSRLNIGEGDNFPPDMGPLERKDCEATVEESSLKKKMASFMSHNSDKKKRFKLPTHLKDCMDAFTEVVFNAAKMKKDRTDWNIYAYRLAYLWQASAYTIHSLEWQQRDPEKSLLGNFTERQEETIRALLLTSAMEPQDLHPSIIQPVAVSLLHTFYQGDDKNHPCILEVDQFGFLVSLIFTNSYIFSKRNKVKIPTCFEEDLALLRMALLAHVVTLMLGMEWQEEEMPMEVEESPADVEEGKLAMKLLYAVRSITNLPLPPEWLSPASLWHRITRECTPFLRCCAIFFKYLTGIPDPPALTQSGGDTFQELCRFLALPGNCLELLASDFHLKMATRWCQHPRIKATLESPKFVRGPIRVNQLVPLPMDFTDLINSVSSVKCRSSDENAANPSMCLVCGRFVCFHGYCCAVKLEDGQNVGPSMFHAYECGAGIGLFLKVRECEAFVLRHHQRGVYITPPYVDKYGETDEGLRRGNPLTLNTKSYKEMHKLWLSHTLCQSTCKILEDGFYPVLTNWQLL
ncbi:E3 ubiquitin-protein ligase UBR2 [Neocloeon triangulifer]|uniref:E3 ubiquitin-protein ligase UBR2 n=1 Tax=Neocloeon triangulifer TaxID=2078957 RepID=UPI00286F2C91|nr:E3 ubiquitin-protein ligase UBR2 [Neocloeon triangulifer]XP_059475775.1 E3 ubiquitin-protein ligase UBR2 [Neocloeon triangulifer]